MPVKPITLQVSADQKSSMDIVHKKKFLGEHTGVRGCDPGGMYYEYTCTHCGDTAWEYEFTDIEPLRVKKYCDEV